MSTRTITRLALLIVFGAALTVFYLAGKAHADPTDGMCGSGKFYNQYSNSCEPTDRGAYPNYPSNGSGGFPRGF